MKPPWGALGHQHLLSIFFWAPYGLGTPLHPVVLARKGTFSSVNTAKLSAVAPKRTASKVLLGLSQGSPGAQDPGGPPWGAAEWAEHL